MTTALPLPLAFLDSLADVPWWSWLLVALVVLLPLLYRYRYEILIRWPLWLLSKTIYSVRVHGLENIPKTGPVLIVCNHVSHIDGGLLLSNAPRPIRFLIWAPFLKLPFLRFFFRLARVIPIDSNAGPRALIQSLRTASEALTNGEVVCIFAEGGITRTGFLLPFHRGLEQILKKSPAPVIPACLDHVWGSIFSYRSGRFFWKVPGAIPYPVYVTFGKPLPPTVKAYEVRQAIQLLLAESAVRRADQRLPVHRQFVRMACAHPLRPCYVDPSNDKKPILCYGEVLAGVKILMRRLRPLLKEDEMVGVWLPPSPGVAMTNIALALLGKVPINLNYTSSPEMVQSAIRQCHIKHVLTSRRFTVRVNIDPGPGVEMVYLEDFRPSIGTWERLRTLLGVLLTPGFIQERLILGLQRHRIGNLATIIFSSGSTGDPKGIMLTHSNIAANCESMIQAIDPTPHDRLLGILPFFHSFGYTVTLWVPLQVGASVVFHPNPLQGREIGELCKKWQPTIMLATPTFLRGYLHRCEPDSFKSLRLLIAGAEKLPQRLVAEFKQKFGIEPLEGYGCTELAPVACACVPDWQEGAQRQVGNKPGTIGQPVPGVAARIVPRETISPENPLPPGEEGLLLIYGANVMKGYLGNDELTKKKIIDGWYVTGDLARMDEDGFITITGREERFAKVGGEMVPLEKVEEELHLALNTSERKCVVTAIPDERKGERIVVLHLPLNGKTVEELREALNARGLPNIYLPGQRDFYQVEELPILGSGKIDLKKCKQQAMELASRE